jgi:hypothetical protein
MQDFLHSFPSQQRDEAVFVFARPYWFAFLPYILTFAFLFLSSIIAQIYTLSAPLGIHPYTQNIITLGLGLFQVAALVVFMIAVLDYYFDLIVVTDRRLADIDQDQLFNRKISTLNLRDVVDVTYRSTGIWQNFLNYGTITVETAGEQPNFVIDNIHYPNEIASIISSLSDQAKDGRPDELRYPQGEVIGVIEGQLIRDAAGLGRVGAMLPEDIRLHHLPNL